MKIKFDECPFTLFTLLYIILVFLSHRSITHLLVLRCVSDVSVGVMKRNLISEKVDFLS